ncbi:zincin-like metallopeptidase domain-containing protein, partial [Dubosiella newyorkensis]
YEIDSKYIQFLREADRRVSVKKHRPFVGILVNVEEIYYCVPLTSQVIPSSGKLRNELVTTIIEDRWGRQVAAVLYNNMIPVSLEVVKDLKPIRNEGIDYIRDEIRFLNRHKQEVVDKASFVLENASKYPFMRKICVNYKRLNDRLALYKELRIKEKGYRKMEKKTLNMKEKLVNEYIKCLEEGNIPWYRGWEITEPIHNMASGWVYKGFNALVLRFESAEKGYKDPRWMTFAQAKKLGYSVKKGAKGVRLDTWCVLDKDPGNGKKAEIISLDEYNKRQKEHGFDRDRYILKNGRPNYVFNAEQINGVPEYEKKLIPIKGNEIIENIPKAMGVELTYGGDKAYYNPVRDVVRLPNKEQFTDEYVYSSTLLHELCHATGHKSRLDRDMTGQFGSENYAKEELRAEIGSSFLMAALQIEPKPEHIQRHKAYIQSWIEVLKKDPGELDKAVKGAERIEKFVRTVGGIDKALEKAQNQEITPEKKLLAKNKERDL